MDGLGACQKAFKKEFFTLRKSRTKHVRMPIFVGSTSNNLVERLNGTVRERGKVMRGMEKEEAATVLMEGLKAYYNFLLLIWEWGTRHQQKEQTNNLELGRNRWHSIIRRTAMKRKSS